MLSNRREASTFADAGPKLHPALHAYLSCVERNAAAKKGARPHFRRPGLFIGITLSVVTDIFPNRMIIPEKDHVKLPKYVIVWSEERIAHINASKAYRFHVQ